MPTIFEVFNVHNHSTESAAALLHLSARRDCRETFESYFSNGMGIAESIKYHLSVLELEDDVTEAMLADASINPKPRTVRWWHDQWRLTNLGPRAGSALVEVCSVHVKLITIHVFEPPHTIRGGLMLHC